MRSRRCAVWKPKPADGERTCSSRSGDISRTPAQGRVQSVVPRPASAPPTGRVDERLTTAASVSRVPGHRKFELVCLACVVSILLGQPAQSATRPTSYQGFYEVHVDGSGLRRLLSRTDGAVEPIAADRRAVGGQRGHSAPEAV